jgi:hypothetical protein
MSWRTFHNRGEILRAVVDTANERRDGVLPTGVPGVAENFADDLDLIGALLLKWHARLSGNIERALLREPMDLQSAVASAWRTTAEQMPGVRLVIDRAMQHPEGPAMEQAMNRAREREWSGLAIAAGLANSHGPAAVEAGRRVEERARLRLDPTTSVAPKTDQGAGEVGTRPDAVSFVDRIKAVIAA